MEYFNLKVNHINHNPGSKFFSYSNLKFFGERESESRVLKRIATVEGHKCYVLSTYQHNAPAGCERHYSYFDVNTFELIKS